MTLDVPSEYENILHDAVASGAFATLEAALLHALNLLAAERTASAAAKLANWNERNQTSSEQSRQGLSKPLNDDEVIGRLNKRFSENEGRN